LNQKFALNLEGTMKCPKCKYELIEEMSPAGALIDRCFSCGGVWLDKGELAFFVKDKRRLGRYRELGLENLKAVGNFCPRDQSGLNSGTLPGFDIEVEECPCCMGLYFDENELESVSKKGLVPIVAKKPQTSDGPKKHPKRSPVLKARFLRNPESLPVKKKISRATLATLPKLPSLLFTSLGVGGGLLGLLLLGIFLASYAGYVSFPLGLLISVGLVGLNFLLGPWFMRLSLGCVGTTDWISHTDLPPHISQFLEEQCQKEGIPIPKIGLIHDSAPTAYTFGHTPSSANLVLSKGIFEMLDEEESKAVVAHELGHIVHWDFAVMTVAQLVPIFLYQIYRVVLKSGKKGSKKKDSGQLVFIAYGAYILYLISDYIVLYLSRVREYWADRYSGRVTENPNAMSKALVKIAYGLSGSSENLDKETAKEKKSARSSMDSFSLSDSKYSDSWGLFAANQSVRDAKDVMRWDMWNPWALYYEMNSTHPLTAKRIQAMSLQAAHMGQEPWINFDDKQPESYWDEFLVDLVMKYLSFVIIILVLVTYPWQNGMGEALWARIIGAIGIAMILRLGFTHNKSFVNKCSVSALLKLIKVSATRGVPATIQGTIIGRGVPGYVFSEDMVIKDSTGHLFLDYQQPLAIWNFLFALFKTDKYIGEEVIVKGWYRRAPVPYFEAYSVQSSSGTSTCYTYHMKWVFGLGLIAFAFALGSGMFSHVTKALFS